MCFVNVVVLLVMMLNVIHTNHLSALGSETQYSIVSSARGYDLLFLSQKPKDGIFSIILAWVFLSGRVGP